MEWFVQLEDTAEWLRGFGLWAVFISLAINIVISLFGVVPSLFLSGANAVVFGLVPGFGISLTGEVLGAIVSFWLYRWGYKRWKKQETDWKWVGRLNEVSRLRRNMILLVSRITPFLPSGVITFAAAASRVAFGDFILVTAVGKAPSIAMETLIGNDLIYIQGNWPRLAITLLLVGLLLLLFRRRKPAEDGYNQARR